MARDARRLRLAGARGLREPSRAVAGRPFSILWSLANGGHEAQGRQVSARRSPGRSPSLCGPPSVPRAGSAEHPAPPPSRERESAALRGRGSAVTWSRGGRRGGGEQGGEGSGVEGEEEGRGRPPQFGSSPGLRHTASPEPPRRPGCCRHRLRRLRSLQSRGERRCRRRRRGPPPPRRPGLGPPAPPQPPAEREPDRAGLGWTGAGAGRRGGRAGKDARAGFALPGSGPGLHPDRRLPAPRCPRPRPGPGRMSRAPGGHGSADAVASPLDMPVRVGAGRLHHPHR